MSAEVAELPGAAPAATPRRRKKPAPPIPPIAPAAPRPADVAGAPGTYIPARPPAQAPAETLVSTPEGRVFADPLDPQLVTPGIFLDDPDATEDAAVPGGGAPAARRRPVRVWGAVLVLGLLVLGAAGYGVYWQAHVNRTLFGAPATPAPRWTVAPGATTSPALAAARAQPATPTRPAAPPTRAVAVDAGAAATHPAARPAPATATPLPPPVKTAVAFAVQVAQVPPTARAASHPPATVAAAVYVVATQVIIVQAPPPPTPTRVLPTPQGQAQAGGSFAPATPGGDPTAWARWWQNPDPCRPDPSGWVLPTPAVWVYSLGEPPCGSHPPTPTAHP